MFVTHSKTPCEVRWISPAGQEIEVIQIHLAVDVFRAALEETYPGKADTVEVIDFFGRDDAFAHLCQACADMLTARTRGQTRRVVDLTRRRHADGVPREALVCGSAPLTGDFEIGNHSPWTDDPHSATLAPLDSPSLKALGERIRQKRKDLDWTQEDLADHAGIDRSYIGGVERGERNLTFTILCQICSAMRCDVAALTQGLPLLPRK